jgi:hypothetical protein
MIMKNRFITFIIALLGIIFLIAPMSIDSYNHHLQNVVYNKAHDTVIECRANLAIDAIRNGRNVVEKRLDRTCGVIPRYDDFSQDEPNGILSFYNWIGQKVTFIPL